MYYWFRIWLLFAYSSEFVEVEHAIFYKSIYSNNKVLCSSSVRTLFLFVNIILN